MTTSHHRVSSRLASSRARLIISIYLVITFGFHLVAIRGNMSSKHWELEETDVTTDNDDDDLGYPRNYSVLAKRRSPGGSGPGNMDQIFGEF